MLQVEWRNEYAIDHGTIDDEHKGLIDMANQIFSLVDPNVQRSEITGLVKSLYRYMEFHFDHEEKLMQQAGFPDRVEHARKHRQIITEMNQTLRRHAGIVEYSQLLQHLMVDWVVHHIIHEDCKLTPYFNKE